MQPLRRAIAVVKGNAWQKVLAKKYAVLEGQQESDLMFGGEDQLCQLKSIRTQQLNA